MKVAVCALDPPTSGIGGAELLTRGLCRALRTADHQVELIRRPFHYQPPEAVSSSMAAWQGALDEVEAERVVCLQFPTYLAAHPRRVLWLLHQHRAVYELWDTPLGGSLSSHHAGRQLRRTIHQTDHRVLPQINPRFTIGARVSARLEEFTQLSSQVLWHPPPAADKFYRRPAEPFIFAPSRLEDHKRQHLLIDAMRHVRSPVVALLAGEGGQRLALEQRIERYGLGDRVRLLGEVDSDTLRALYSLCLAVFFAPFDEDYGYVTLEAMLASKPVLTTLDAGGPLEFVVANETGWVVAPEAKAIADQIDRLAGNRRLSEELGSAGRQHYDSLGISWQRVVSTLLAKAPPAADLR